MRRLIRTACLACGLLLLAACQHKDKNTPLAFAPADTPFVAANLKPLDDDASKALLAQADTQLPTQRLQLRQAAANLHARQHNSLANVMDVLAKELDGKTSYRQVADDIGIDMHGLGAFYGVGLVPVLRLQVADSKRFDAFVQRLANAAGSPLKTHTTGALSYHSTQLGSSRLQLVSADQHGQAVLALVPGNAAAPLLEQVLGAQRPQRSVQDSERLEKLAESKDYSPYAVADLDTSRLGQLLTGGKDPMVQAVYDMIRAARQQAPQPLPALPARCGDDVARIASRVPRISMGYTQLKPGRIDQRLDIALADDITRPFEHLAVALPGLGDSSHLAPFDLSLALPMTEIRDFWAQQAKDVAEHPFSCPALAKLNQGFAKLGAEVGKLAIPPLGDVRGLRLALQKFSLPAQGRPQAQGALLLASNNPAGLLAIAQATVPALSTLKVDSDTRPVTLPSQLDALTGGKGWVAMSAHALGVAVGPGQDDTLQKIMHGSSGKAGQWLRVYVSGAMYSQWLTSIMRQASQRVASSDPASAMRLEQQSQAIQRQFAHIESVSAQMRMEDDGLVITSRTRWK